MLIACKVEFPEGADLDEDQLAVIQRICEALIPEGRIEAARFICMQLTGHRPTITQTPATEHIWKCKIGGNIGPLPEGADKFLREAVQKAYRQLTGIDAEFTFSGWGAKLTEHERDVVDQANFQVRKGVPE